MSIVDAVMSTAERILREELAADQELCQVTLVPGDAVPFLYGTETCGGMAWVRLDSAYPSTSFPAPNNSVDNCVDTLAVAFEVGILRPMPISSDPEGQEPPSEEQFGGSSHKQYADMDIMLKVMRRIASDIDLAEGLFVLGRYTPAGSEGGVTGGYWQATLTMDEQ